jgi:diguanylate cyclase (GGDEF)-like protein/PAS domain S-box-containing protein
MSNHLIWIANGVLLAYLLLVPRKLWAYYLCAGYIGQVTGSMLVKALWQQNVVFDSLNIAEVLISAFLLRRSSTGLPRFTNRAYLIRFVGFAVIVGPLIAGSIYTLIQTRWFPAAGTGLTQWAVADGLGAAVATPACVAVFRAHFKNPLSLGEHWGYLILLMAVTPVAFSQNTVSVLFIVYPLLILLLARLGLGWAAMATLFVTSIGSFYTLRGHGPFGVSHSASQLDPAIGLQIYIASALFMLYTVSVVLESHKAIESRLKKIVALHSLVTENSRDAIILADFDGNRSYISAATLSMFGWSEQELSSLKTLDLLHPEDRANVELRVRELRSGAEGAIVEARVRRQSGEYIWVEANLRVIRDPKSGKPSGLLNIVRDITERKRAEHARMFHLSLLGAIHEVSLDGILVVNEEGHVTSYNRRFSDVWKLSATELPASLLENKIDLPDSQLLSQCVNLTKDPSGFLKRVRELYANPEANDHCQFELRDGRTLERYSTGIHSDAGARKGRVWFFRDITERKRAERQLQEAYRAVESLAVTDSLTGLANRREFDQCLTAEWRRCLRDRSPLSMLLLDVDLFKAYNDTYGHVRGDSCLKQIAEAAQDVVTRPGDIVARFGGEEFAIVLPNTDNEGASKVAQGVWEAVRNRNLHHTASPFERVTISVGCATILPSLGRNSIDIVELADKALYQAKRNGRDQVCKACGEWSAAQPSKTAELSEIAISKTA